MTGPGEPTPPAEDGESRPSEDDRPPAERPPAPTGWPGRPEATRFGGTTPGSVLPSSTPRPETFRVPPPDLPQPSAPSTAATQPLPAAGSEPVAEPSPVRPPVPTGVPPRPSPLPPPRATEPRPGAGSTAAGTAGSMAGPSAPSGPATTVVPEGVRRPAPRPSVPRGGPSTRGRKAKLAVKRLDPWSVFVTSLVLSLLLGVITIIAAFVLYAALSALGVPSSINTNIGDITKNQNILTQGKFVGIAALIAAANVLLLTALATIGAMLYNVVATFTGGLELTLSERD